MVEDLQAKWDRIHSQGGWAAPADVLTRNAHLLPPRGGALDVACGLGSNALFLAARGLAVEAWDISPVAIRRLQEKAGEAGLKVKPRRRDVIASSWPEGGFDVIVVSHFLSRKLCPRIQAALRPGGLLFYQTFVMEKISPAGPSNPDYLLAENELLQLFQGLRIRAYREEGRCGDISKGWRNEAYLVGQKLE